LKFDKLASTVKKVYDKVKSYINTPINAAKSTVKTMYDKVKGWLKFNSVSSTVKKVFDDIKEKITGPINTAKGVVENAWKKITGLFPIKLGKIFSGVKLPHFKISGGKIPWGIGGAGEKPKVSIEWYKKAMNGAMALDGATIFGSSGGKLLGGGEAGRELVVGEKYALDMIRKASGNENTELLLLRLINLLERWLPQKTVAYINKNDVSSTVNRELGKLMI